MRIEEPLFSCFFLLLLLWLFSFVCTFSLCLLAVCTAHHRLRDLSTTGLESSIYWSWVISQKKKERQNMIGHRPPWTLTGLFADEQVCWQVCSLTNHFADNEVADKMFHWLVISLTGRFADKSFCWQCVNCILYYHNWKSPACISDNWYSKSSAIIPAHSCWRVSGSTKLARRCTSCVSSVLPVQSCAAAILGQLSCSGWMKPGFLSMRHAQL